MSKFIPNPFSNKSYEYERYEYLQKVSINNDTVRAINNSCQLSNAMAKHNQAELLNTINSTANLNRQAIKESTDAIVSSVDTVNYTLDKINDSLGDIAGAIDYGFSLLSHKLAITNDLLESIQELCKIPDTQKTRVHYIEKGLEYLFNAFIDGLSSDFFEQARIQFAKAVELEDNDFFSLYRLGIIHFNSLNHLDLLKAEKYFKEAAKYYLSASRFGGTTASNNLLPNAKHPNFYIKEGTEALIYQAQACYSQSKLEEAINLSKQSWETYKENGNGGFHYAKYLSIANKHDQSARVLESVIRHHREFILSARCDKDLIKNPIVLDLFIKLKDEATNSAIEKFNRHVDKLQLASNKYKELLEIKKGIEQNTYLDSLKALDQLSNLNN